MPPIIEVRYIHIKWRDKHAVSSIKEGGVVLPSVAFDGSTIYFDLTAYTRLEDEQEPAQPAFYIGSAEEEEVTPFWLSGGKKEPLRNVIDPATQKVWWIEDGEWDKSGKYFKSRLWNTDGTAELEIGNVRCVLTIRSMEPQARMTILEAFRQELSALIHNPKSYVSDSVHVGGTACGGTPDMTDDKRLAELLKKYLRHLANIVERPKKRLRETQSEQSLNKLRPAAKTFVEFSANPTRQKYTGKTVLESFDTAENRYVCYTLKIVQQIVAGTGSYQESSKRFLEREIVKVERQLAEIQDFILIDKLVFHNTLRKTEMDYAALQNRITEAISRQTRKQFNWQSEEFELSLTQYSREYNSWLGWFSDEIPVDNVFWFDDAFDGIFRPGEKYKISAHIEVQDGGPKPNRGIWNVTKMIPVSNKRNVVEKGELKNAISAAINRQTQYETRWEPEEFEITVKEYQHRNKFWIGRFSTHRFFHFDDAFTNILHDRGKYRISAHVAVKNTDQHPNRYIWNITAMIQVDAENRLKQLLNDQDRLERSNWKRPPTTSERAEQNKHRTALENELSALKERLVDIDSQRKNTLDAISPLDKIARDFSKFGVRPSPGRPSSMSFVQNPDYRGAHHRFIELKELLNLDDNLLEAMGRVEQIGILDNPKIYERWCLVQVIKTLTELFGFVSVKNWRRDLVMQLVGLGKKNDIQLQFTHEHTGWDLVLWYEYVLPNNDRPYRPDIKLDLALKNDKNEIENYTLVMDAKYYTKGEYIIREIPNLYLKKNYSQDDSNLVFILHPCGDAIAADKILTPQAWGKHSFYGESEMFEWEEEDLQRYDKNLHHRYGMVFLYPEDESGGYLDNLQRLIGMFLQYPFYSKHDKAAIESGKHYFCITCGGSDYDFRKGRTENGYPIYTVTCKNKHCKHSTTLTHCAMCHTPIFKHSPQWSYHRAEVQEPYNISCPLCKFHF